MIWRTFLWVDLMKSVSFILHAACNRNLLGHSTIQLSGSRPFFSLLKQAHRLTGFRVQGCEWTCQ